MASPEGTQPESPRDKPKDPGADTDFQTLRAFSWTPFVHMIVIPKFGVFLLLKTFSTPVPFPINSSFPFFPNRSPREGNASLSEWAKDSSA